VSWELNGTYLGGATRSSGGWLPDTVIASDIPQDTDDDYKHSGFDRGHMCPSSDRTRTPDTNTVTFTLTNVLPQLHAVNAGPWEKLESYLQDQAANGMEIFVTSGGIYDSAGQTIGNGVAVPTATWKVAVIMDDLAARAPQVHANTRVIAVIMSNDGSVQLSDDWHGYRTTVRDIEGKTGLNLLSDVDPSVQDTIENRIDDLP
jgi:endonuclease G